MPVLDQSLSLVKCQEQSVYDKFSLKNVFLNMHVFIL